MALYFVLKKSKRGLAQILTGTYEYEVAFQDPDNHSSLSYLIASCTRGKKHEFGTHRPRLGSKNNSTVYITQNSMTCNRIP